MRRILGIVLTVLGVIFVVLGLLAKPVLYNRLATTALDQQSTSVSQGSGMKALHAHNVGSSAAFDRLTDVQLRSTRQVRGIPGQVEKAGKTDTDAFWQTTVRSQANIDGTWTDLTYSDEGVSFDRVTGESTNCCGDYHSIGDLEDESKTEPIKHEGQFFKMPFNTQKKTYAWWDGDLGKAAPMNFQRVETVEGAETYVFQQVIDKQQIDERKVPRSLFEGPDAPSGDVDARLMYGNTRTLWIEPNTGVIIKGEEQIDKTFESDGLDSVPVTIGTIGYDAKTIADNAATYGSKGKTLGFVRDLLMPIGLVLGLLLTALGVFLLLGDSRRQSRHDDDDLDSLIDSQARRRSRV